MIRAEIALGLVRMIEAVLVLVEEGIFDLIRTSRVVVVTLEEAVVPNKRLVRGTCSRYVLSLWKASNCVSTFVLRYCRCLMSFYRQQALGVKSSGRRLLELHVAGIWKGVSVLEIQVHCSGLPKVEVMPLVNVRMCEMLLAVAEEAFEVVHCNDR